MPDRRVTLREASVLLGVSEGAIRKRVARGTIRSEMGEDGRRYVYVDEGTDGGADASSPGESGALRSEDPLYEQMRERIAYLERQVEEEREARRRADTLLARLMDRVPELEAPSAPRDEPETAEEQQGRGVVRSDSTEAQEGVQRPWWRRVFGG